MSPTPATTWSAPKPAPRSPWAPRPTTIPTQLTSATPGYNPTVYATEQSLDLQGPPAPDFLYNARGAQEKYLVSGNGSNAAAGSYYILMPNGNLYAWIDNSLTASLMTAPVATVPFAYYQNPNFLINPAPPGRAAVGIAEHVEHRDDGHHRQPERQHAERERPRRLPGQCDRLHHGHGRLS